MLAEKIKIKLSAIRGKVTKVCNQIAKYSETDRGIELEELNLIKVRLSYEDLLHSSERMREIQREWENAVDVECDDLESHYVKCEEYETNISNMLCLSGIIIKDNINTDDNN